MSGRFSKPNIDDCPAVRTAKVLSHLKQDQRQRELKCMVREEPTTKDFKDKYKELYGDK
jgi:hypothetical protein